MYGYEGWWSFDPVSIGYEAVPTAAKRRGDFSSLLALGTRYQIYDPLLDRSRRERSFQPAASGRQLIPPSRIRSGGREDRALFDHAQSRGQCGWRQ